MANNASDVLSVAAGEVGYCDYVNDADATGTKYGRFYADLTGEPYFGGDNVAWCAMFVSWVFAQAGATCPGIPKVFLSISFFHVWHRCLSALAMKVFMFGKAYHIESLTG